MATHEPELVSPVLLCEPDGKRLSAAARGWSRRPLHTANLRGTWGRTKKWDYWAVLTDRLCLSVTYADVDYLGIADVWWCDLTTSHEGGHAAQRPGARGISLPDRPGSAPLSYRSKGLDIDLVDDPRGTTITGRWKEKDGTLGSLDLRIELPPNHDSLNVVIPWSNTRFQYTSKHQARPAHGTLVVGDVVRPIGTDPTTGSGTPAWGVLDVGRGRWPYSTRWNWGGGAGRSTAGSSVGIQIGAKWTEGTGFTENGIIVDGRLTKIGDELLWEYDWERPLRPWRVRHPDGSFDLTLTPNHDRHSKVNAAVLATEVHQVFGRWTGHVTDDSGTQHQVDGILGFAEESRSRW